MYGGVQINDHIPPSSSKIISPLEIKYPWEKYDHLVLKCLFLVKNIRNLNSKLEITMCFAKTFSSAFANIFLQYAKSRYLLRRLNRGEF